MNLESFQKADVGNAPRLHRRLLRHLTALFAAMGIFCIAITGGTLYLHYRSAMVKETAETSAHLTRLLLQLHEDLDHHAQLLARIHRGSDVVGEPTSVLQAMEAQTFKWFHQMGLEVLGTGSASHWLRRGFSAADLRDSHEGRSAVFLHKSPEGVFRMVSAVRVRADFLEPEYLLVALKLDDSWLQKNSEFIGSEIALCDSSGRVAASSLPLGAGRLHLPMTGEEGDFFSINGEQYGFRTFPLTFESKTLGYYALLTPARSMRSLATTLSGILGLSLAAALGLAYFVVLRLMGGVTREVTSLATWADSYEHFPAASPPSTVRFHETQVLARAFGDLVQRLDAAKSEIERRNLGLERDVAEKTAESVKQSLLMDLILSELPLGILLTERNGRVAYANERAAKDFGIAAGVLLSPPLEGIAANLGVKNRFVEEFRHQGRDFKLVCHSLENPFRRLFVVEDLTDRHAMEERLSQAQKLESVSRLAGGVAHDFNNALASIMPCVDLLREKFADPKALSYVDSIEKAALRGADVVRQLLAFSRAGAFNPRKIDLNQTVEGAIKLFRPTAKQTEVEWAPGRDLPPLHGDESQIQQMLLNLAINSLDAMGGRGTIRFETWTDRVRGRVCVAVTDSGPGVPPDIAKLIFDPFFTTKEQGKGTGLGLSVAYGVVQRHHGDIRLVRDWPEGARFEIAFPMLAGTGEPQGSPAAGAPRGSDGSGGDIVIGG